MFNESEWIKLLFLLSDTQQWLNDMNNQLFLQIPIENKKKFLRKNYYLTVTAFAHIIERHYYKIPRHPGTGKFQITIPEILHYIREAANATTTPIHATQNLLRTIETGQTIGFDKNTEPTQIISIVTDAGGKIITAYPGVSISSIAKF